MWKHLFVLFSAGDLNIQIKLHVTLFLSFCPHHFFLDESKMNFSDVVIKYTWQYLFQKYTQSKT